MNYFVGFGGFDTHWHFADMPPEEGDVVFLIEWSKLSAILPRQPVPIRRRQLFQGGRMTSCPTVDESLDRLRRADWSIGDAAFPEHALIWLVTGNNGENLVKASGKTRAEAYWRVCVQAREVGMPAWCRDDATRTAKTPLAYRREFFLNFSPFFP